jgi:lipopolysaccharide transport system ATP-binding protein
MTDIVIKAENLGKKYVIGHQAENVRYLALRDVLVQNARNFWHKTTDLLRGNPIIQGATHEEVWALREVSFEVQRGEVLGIIGRNGAGKSTLLKVLSRITEPSAGRVTIKGRVASLLEVGTGFHPELTGRENIYLNGAILGMTRVEIKRKFDEIVAFAEVEKFLDTPVKRYSSGMYVRLAFAVAAHLEPEILIVDEVLAVGDAQFQKKCLGKMEDVGKEGRTVLFVSHNMTAIQQLCGSGILLRDGIVRDTGSIEKVIETYLNDSTSIGKESIGDIPRTGHDYGVIARFINAWPLNSKGERTTSFMSGEDISFDLEIKAFENVDNLSIVAGLDTYMDYRITTVLSEEAGMLFSSDKDAVISINLKFPKLHLKPGTYSLTLGIRRNKVTFDQVVKAIHFEVSEVSTNSRFRESHLLGDVLVESTWNILNAKTKYIISK